MQNEFKTQELPLARIKKIMKLDEDVKVIMQFINYWLCCVLLFLILTFDIY